LDVVSQPPIEEAQTTEPSLETPPLPLEKTVEQVESKPSVQPVTQPDQEDASTRPGEAEEPTVSSEPPVEVTPTFQQPVSAETFPSMGMPLAKKVVGHRQTADTFKAVEDGVLKSKIDPSIMSQPERPLVSVNKFPQKTPSPPDQDIQKPSPAFGRPQIQPDGAFRSEAGSEPTIHPPLVQRTVDDEAPIPGVPEPLPLSLAFPPSLFTPSVDAVDQVSPPTPMTVQPTSLETQEPLEEQEPPFETQVPEAPTTGSEVIQRVWEEHQGSDEGVGMGGFERETPEPEDDEIDINLEQLAEEVLPHIKRILEIEAERQSNIFR
jgi:hypothetical protein